MKFKLIQYINNNFYYFVPDNGGFSFREYYKSLTKEMPNYKFWMYFLENDDTSKPIVFIVDASSDTLNILNLENEIIDAYSSLWKTKT